MEVIRRSIKGIAVVLFLACVGFLSGVIAVKIQNRFEPRLSPKKIAGRDVKKDITNVNQITPVPGDIKTVIGPTWESFIDRKGHLQGDPEGSLPNIYLVSAGSWITDRIPITTKEGEVLATALVSQKGYYLDSQGRSRSVMVPRAIELPSGEVVLYGTRYWFLPENEKVADDIITLHPRAFVRGGFAGSVFSVSLMPDTSLIGGPRADDSQRMMSIIDRFNASWKDEMADFIAGGISDIKMLFPWSWGNFEPKTVDLPSIKL